MTRCILCGDECESVVKGEYREDFGIIEKASFMLYRL